MNKQTKEDVPDSFVDETGGLQGHTYYSSTSKQKKTACGNSYGRAFQNAILSRKLL